MPAFSMIGGVIGSYVGFLIYRSNGNGSVQKPDLEEQRQDQHPVSIQPESTRKRSRAFAIASLDSHVGFCKRDLTLVAQADRSS